jgi:hypothetical protein
VVGGGFGVLTFWFTNVEAVIPGCRQFARCCAAVFAAVLLEGAAARTAFAAFG